MFGRFTLDTSVDFLFGAQVGSLKMATESAPPTPLPGSGPTTQKTDRGSSLPFVTAFNEVQRTVTHRLKLGPIWPLFELRGDKTAPQMKVINVSAVLSPLLVRPTCGSDFETLPLFFASQDFTRPILEQALEKRRNREKDGELGADDDDESEEDEGQSLLDVLIFKSEDLKFGQSHNHSYPPHRLLSGLES